MLVVTAIAQAHPSRQYLHRTSLGKHIPSPINKVRYRSTVNSRMAGEGLGKLAYRVKMGAWDVLGQECSTSMNEIC